MSIYSSSCQAPAVIMTAIPQGLAHLHLHTAALWCAILNFRRWCRKSHHKESTGPKTPAWSVPDVDARNSHHALWGGDNASHRCWGGLLAGCNAEGVPFHKANQLQPCFTGGALIDCLAGQSHLQGQHARLQSILSVCGLTIVWVRVALSDLSLRSFALTMPVPEKVTLKPCLTL